MSWHNNIRGAALQPEDVAGLQDSTFIGCPNTILGTLSDVRIPGVSSCQVDGHDPSSGMFKTSPHALQ